MTTIKRFLETTKSLLTNPRALAILATLYALLLATLGAFIKIREATLLQVVVTLFFLVLIPVEFFVLQAAILQHARTEKFRWAQTVRDAIKIAVVSIPIDPARFCALLLAKQVAGALPSSRTIASVASQGTTRAPTSSLANGAVRHGSMSAAGSRVTAGDHSAMD